MNSPTRQRYSRPLPTLIMMVLSASYVVSWGLRLPGIIKHRTYELALGPAILVYAGVLAIDLLLLRRRREPRYLVAIATMAFLVLCALGMLHAAYSTRADRTPGFWQSLIFGCLFLIPSIALLLFLITLAIREHRARRR